MSHSFQNILSRKYSITPHFAGESKNMSLSCKIMSLRLQNITLCLVILILCFFSITFLTGSIFGISLSGNNTSALTYSTNQDISFTFAPSLSITLSDTDLVIDTLAPGNTAESNTITVSVASNTPYGYALYADVGSNDTESTYYNTSDLIRSDNINATFTSIATNASLSTLDTDNTWGYSTSKDNGTTWSTYNGLPTATSTIGSTSTSNPAVLIDTKLPADSQSIALKVAVRASTTQASGAYSNIINFYAVGKPEPIYMQETEAIKSQLKNNGDELQAIDIRDGKEYWVAKLADGNIWMTQNLDLDIVAGKKYTSKDTDLQYSDIGTSWTANNSTTTSPSWAYSSHYFPRSYDPGNYYWRGKIAYNPGNNVTTAPSDISEGAHYHIGNYYNWTAAVAMNNSSSYKNNPTDVNQSICPAGWRLPTYNGDKSYQNLINIQNLTAGTNGNIHAPPTYFVYSYHWNGNRVLEYIGQAGYYWSSTVQSDVYAYDLFFHYTGSLNTQSGNAYRAYENTIRCVMR